MRKYHTDPVPNMSVGVRTSPTCLESDGTASIAGCSVCRNLWSRSCRRRTERRKCATNERCASKTAPASSGSLISNSGTSRFPRPMVTASLTGAASKSRCFRDRCDHRRGRDLRVVASGPAIRRPRRCANARPRDRESPEPAARRRLAEPNEPRPRSFRQQFSPDPRAASSDGRVCKN